MINNFLICRIIGRFYLKPPSFRIYLQCNPLIQKQDLPKWQFANKVYQNIQSQDPSFSLDDQGNKYLFIAKMSEDKRLQMEYLIQNKHQYTITDPYTGSEYLEEKLNVILSQYPNEILHYGFSLNPRENNMYELNTKRYQLGSYNILWCFQQYEKAECYNYTIGGPQPQDQTTQNTRVQRNQSILYKQKVEELNTKRDIQKQKEGMNKRMPLKEWRREKSALNKQKREIKAQIKRKFKQEKRMRKEMRMQIKSEQTIAMKQMTIINKTKKVEAAIIQAEKAPESGSQIIKNDQGVVWAAQMVRNVPIAKNKNNILLRSPVKRLIQNIQPAKTIVQQKQQQNPQPDKQNKDFIINKTKENTNLFSRNKNQDIFGVNKCSQKKNLFKLERQVRNLK